MASPAILVLSTAGSAEQAEAIANALVEQALAACVNIIGPMRSIYRWRGAVEREQEWLLLIKSEAEQLARLERCVRELHSYEVPEIITLPITGGSADYLAWLSSELADASGA
ncbi:MAG TPA: divalent-cation tolerance protein CutA [Terriglobales bacterium]|nr:divalent-cation tolerance protein CutA [Terriglobales bacterium]